MSKTDLESKTKAELLKMAQRLGLRGISTLGKAELVERIHDAQEHNSSKAARQPVGIAAVARKVADAVKRRAIRKREKAETAAAPAKRATTRGAKRSPIAASPIVEGRATDAETPSDELSAHKFDVTPAPPPPVQAFHEEHLGELPDAYGTGRLFLTARDPHWLYAYWDWSWQQMADYRGQSSDGRLLLRVFEKNHAKPIQEFTLQHDSRNWYVPVNKAATTYSADLGFWRHDGSFQVISRSRETSTPPDSISHGHHRAVRHHSARYPVPRTVQPHSRPHARRRAPGRCAAPAAAGRLPFPVQARTGTRAVDGRPSRRAGTHPRRGSSCAASRWGPSRSREWLRRRLQEELSSGMFSAFSPAGSSWSGLATAEGFLVCRQRRTDHLRRDGTRCQSHCRRQADQAAQRRHVFISLCLPRRAVPVAGRGDLGGGRRPAVRGAGLRTPKQDEGRRGQGQTAPPT